MNWRFYLITTILSFSSVSYGWDAVAVFYRPEKVVIQINEENHQGRLDQLIRVFQKEDNLLLLSRDKSFKLNCARGTIGITCIFRFLPSPMIKIENRTVSAQLNIKDLNLLPEESSELEISFLNSNDDYMKLTVLDEKVLLIASKR